VIGDLLRVPVGGTAGGGTIDLAEIDPASTPGLPAGKSVRRDPKRWALAQLANVGEELAGAQERLFASAKCAGDRRRLLIVLQAMDCGGKDGTVRHVAGLLNPQGIQLVSFGVPTAEEREHDFLWRIRRGLPPAGYVGVFNRSHYEDVLVVRVHNLVPKRTWARRYDQINRFEKELVDDGVVLVKIMLHISYDEQCERLRDRLDDPTKYWKYNPSDVDERKLWPEYQAAYADALARCSTEYAPWHVVPADRKWYRNWAVSRLLAEAFAGMDLRYPPPNFDLAVEKTRLQC
jgi:PPK2 family polyphosphate:nucleotide phosphotransferase